MKNNDQRSSLVWLIGGVTIAVYSGNYGLGTLSSPGPGFVPMISGLAMAGFSLVAFFQQFKGKGKEGLKELWTRKDWPTMLKVMGALVLYAIFLKILGFLVATFLLIAYFFRVIEPMSWAKVIAGAALISCCSYAIFQLWLEAQLPSGILGF